MRAGRRALGAFALASLGAAAATPSPLRFAILRQGSRIGTHAVAFTEEAGRLTARTDVDITVRLAGFTVFRLAHAFEEVWAAGRLVGCTSRLTRAGTTTTMRARAEPGGIVIEGDGGARRLPPDAAPLTWWEPGRFAGPLFDNATGAALALRWSSVTLPGGATRWRCEGEEESEGTYAPDLAWTGWRTRGEDGSTVTYAPA